jgi:hypothetical protein
MKDPGHLLAEVDNAVQYAATVDTPTNPIAIVHPAYYDLAQYQDDTELTNWFTELQDYGPASITAATVEEYAMVIDAAGRMIERDRGSWNEKWWTNYRDKTVAHEWDHAKAAAAIGNLVGEHLGILIVDGTIQPYYQFAFRPGTLTRLGLASLFAAPKLPSRVDALSFTAMGYKSQLEIAGRIADSNHPRRRSLRPPVRLAPLVTLPAIDLNLTA